MRLRPVYYIYPLNKWVSFRSIAEAHVRELRKYFYVQVYDEEAATIVIPIALCTSSPLFILHPYFYPMSRYEARLKAKLGRIRNVIGVDVADTNHISEHAVKLSENAEALIVPSNFSRNTYVNSGVKVPVHAVPHGIPDDWIDRPPPPPRTFKTLADYKRSTGKKILHVWVLHSWFRKGEDLAYQIFNKLVRERKDVALAIRRPLSIDVYESEVSYTVTDNNLTINSRPKLTVSSSWLKEEEIEELLAICDIFLLTSRGGGFEHPPLLAIGKGELAIGAKGGAWDDYLPEWALVKSHESPPILPGNPIHDGTGVEMETEDAVNLLHNMLDNMDEYRAKMRQHVQDKIKNEFTWSKIGLKLRDILIRYLV